MPLNQGTRGARASSPTRERPGPKNASQEGWLRDVLRGVAPPVTDDSPVLTWIKCQPREEEGQSPTGDPKAALKRDRESRTPHRWLRDAQGRCPTNDPHGSSANQERRKDL